MNKKHFCILSLIVVCMFQFYGCGVPASQDFKRSIPSTVDTTHAKQSTGATVGESDPTNEIVKSYPSAMKPFAEHGNAAATNEDMQQLLSQAEAYFDSKPLSEIMSQAGNGTGEASAPIKPGSAITMFYRTSKPIAPDEVPIVAVEFGLGFNMIEAHALLWYENGKWKSQAYPQANDEVAKQRESVLSKGNFGAGSFFELHQRGKLLVVVNNYYGTKNAQEVQLLERKDEQWEILWVPTYDDWRILYESRVEMQNGISQFTVSRTDIKDPHHQWQEIWKLQDFRYVMVSTTK